MLQVIISIIGLIIVVFVFALIADKFPSITNCIPLAIFVFVLLWGASICISYIAWWIGIIVAIVALIVYIIKKKKPLQMDNNEPIDNNQEDNNESK